MRITKKITEEECNEYFKTGYEADGYKNIIQSVGNSLGQEVLDGYIKKYMDAFAAHNEINNSLMSKYFKEYVTDTKWTTFLDNETCEMTFIHD